MTAAASAVPLAEVLLIDLSSLYWTNWHATRDSSVSEAASLTSAAIRRAVGNSGALVAICCDQGRSFRKTLSPDYKANRPEKDQSALSELDRLKERLRDDGYWLIGADGFEADDVIATLATAASSKGHPIRIASADKDLLQLLALPDSSALRTFNDWATVRAVDVVTKFGVDPEGLRDWLALVGDTSDNIKGCPSVGAKTATALLLAHFDIDGIYAKIDALSFGDTTSPAAKAIATPAVVGKLAAHKADVMLARKLVTLRTDAPVSLDPIYERREPKTTPLENIDMDGTDEDETPAPSPITAADVRAGAFPKEQPAVSADSSPAVAAPVSQDSASTAQTSLSPAPAPAETRVTVIAPYERQLEPTSLGTAFKLGLALYESRLYSRFPTAQAITAVVMRGREMGIGALTALDCFHVVEGKPFASAHLLIARAKADPDCEYFQLIDAGPESATWETKNRRNPKPTRYTYTLAQAVKAGLTSKERSPWNTRPEDMVIKTAGAKLAKIEYTSASLGLTSIEEMGEE